MDATGFKVAISIRVSSDHAALHGHRVASRRDKKPLGKAGRGGV
jgi:hypothetical protein